MEIKKLKNENRKHYLARICIVFLENDNIESITYDEADCDKGCLVDDLRDEYSLDD